MNNQIRRIFKLAMMLMLVLTCVKLKIDIKAEDSVPTVKVYSEQTVNGIPWKVAIYTDGTVAIKPTKMEYKYIEVEIPSKINSYTVNAIETKAFDGWCLMTKVLIPNSVTKIGRNAFNGCQGLTSLAIGDNVTSIGYEAFWCCNKLESISIGSGVQTIGAKAFDFCSKLSEIHVSAQNKYYSSENGVLYNKDKTELIRCAENRSGDYTTPSSVLKIDEWAFWNCKNIKNVKVTDNVKVMQWFAIYQSGITSIQIGSGIEVIDQYACGGCLNLTKVSISEGVNTILNGAFMGCTSLEEITLPVSVNEIRGSAFKGCSNLEKASYLGTQQQWNSLKKNIQDGNDELINAIEEKYKDSTVTFGHVEVCGSNVTLKSKDGYTIVKAAVAVDKEGKLQASFCDNWNEFKTYQYKRKLSGFVWTDVPNGVYTFYIEEKDEEGKSVVTYEIVPIFKRSTKEEAAKESLKTFTKYAENVLSSKMSEKEAEEGQECVYDNIYKKLEGSIVQAKNLVNETELVYEELIQCGLQLQDNIMKYNKYVFTKPEDELYAKVCVSMKDKTKVAIVKGTYSKWSEFKDSGYVV